MAKDKVKEESGDELPPIKQSLPEAGPVNLHERVKVKVINETDKTQPPYHKHGEVVEMHPEVAKKFAANGWGKLVMLALFFCASLVAGAQSTSYQSLKKVVSNLPTTAYKLISSDTVTNTATNFLTSGYPQTGTTYSGSPVAIVNPSYSTTVQANFTKISGTLAGTATLQGSMDGTTYSTVTSAAYAITATYTVTDVASQSKSWVLLNNPYRFYRISWTGTGTMSGSMTAQVWSH